MRTRSRQLSPRQHHGSRRHHEPRRNRPLRPILSLLLLPALLAPALLTPGLLALVGGHAGHEHGLHEHSLHDLESRHTGSDWVVELEEHAPHETPQVERAHLTLRKPCAVCTGQLRPHGTLRIGQTAMVSATGAEIGPALAPRTPVSRPRHAGHPRAPPRV